jgi:hypothetical protein
MDVTTPTRTRRAFVISERTWKPTPRLVEVVAGPVTAIAAWAVASPALGVSLVARFGNGKPETINAGLVLGASFIASILGWASLVLFQRRSSNGLRTWTILAVAVAVASLALPLSAATTTAGTVALIVIHVAVATAVIPLLRRSADR